MAKNVLLLRGVCAFVFFLSLLRNGYAQSPTNLTSNVALVAPSQTDFAPSAFFSSTAQIVAAFNAARRAEETQLGLPTNSLGNLSLPANYATFSANDRALFLINQERIARSGLVYPGTTAVLGLPMEAVESALVNTAQTHASYLVANNVFSHTGSGGSTPSTRVGNTYPANCQTGMGYSENIYVACSSSATTPTFLVEQAIFNWLYRDSANSWGHRKAMLIQNDDIYLAPPPNTLRGYVNDHGSASSEGFLGIGIASTTVGAYSASCSGSFAGHVVVMNIADPTADASCTFSTSDALPVHLLHFSGVSREDKAVLGWSTNWEDNNLGFDVLKSRDAKAFEKIGFVQGNGTRSETNTYSWTDAEVIAGETYYYRLRQIDANGRTELSKIIAVPIESANRDRYLFPNPSADGRFTLVAADSEQLTVKLVNTAGMELPVRTLANAASMNVIPGQLLPPGLYWVKVQDANGRVQKVLRLLVGH
ncbi:T9SS type A sorting domain-containing protein [Larkinella rosea]|uniref:T9SS C-terminal target domain-containing protein n=1 Tax=Larkinella rosea TaxID=2025312 RepID=A0A3P1BM10_9BACT|nr:T9SS type A sorting domain-containing protein [Larkinella rosea]RRB02081.1 T9SS C-terminal target domain-containing protein [Larkinella rosea]